MTTDNINNELSVGSSNYAEILRHAVAVIEHARTEIAQHVNGYVSTAYWEIGQMLHERKIESGYGDRVVRRLSTDLKERYPKLGVSPRNLWDMKKFYERFCHSDIKVRQAVALLPWGHILRLLQKVGNDDAAILFYAQETRSKGWNRDLLLNAIKLNMYEAQALARVDNNFNRTLPAEQAQYANEVFSSSYNLVFLGVTSPILEFELEDRLERGADENRSIGIILCAEKDRVEVELALEDMGKPIGVADYQLIVPKEKLQKVLADEIKAFSEEKEKKEVL